MLGALAAVVFIVGTIGATVSVTETNRQAADQAREPVVTEQTIESADTLNQQM